MNALAGERERTILTAILSGETIREELFSQVFLAQVSLAQIRAATEQIIDDIGPLVAIDEQGELYLVKTSTHEMPIQIVLDENGQITGLLFRPAVLTGMDRGDIFEAIHALEGEISYLVTRDGEALYQHNSDLPLAVGSAFKLAVLAVLAEKISDGSAHWEDVVHLETRQISLPSGILQNIGAGAPLTLHTLAALMISISDNTGTDALLDYVGREAVAAKLGTEFVLKTRELFLLKADAALRARFLAGDVSDRNALAVEMDGLPLPDGGAASGQHVQGVEYYVPVNRLCALIHEVSALELMTINPGVASKRDWQRVAYKDGSEQGVINFTTEVTGEEGVQICVSLTWNTPDALDEKQAVSLYAALLKSLARGE